jgi:hypothetical protein
MNANASAANAAVTTDIRRQKFFDWTPSIVPNGDDQNVYLVVDDFRRSGRVYRATDVETADLETVILDLLAGEYKTPSESSPSTPSKAGRKTPPKISPKSCAAAAIYNCGTYPPAFRILSSATRATTVN